MAEQALQTAAHVPDRSNVHCPTCGTRWRHREAIGHCAACHHTFIGSTAFDRHQHLGEDGRPECLEPDQVLRESGGPVFEAVSHSAQLVSGVFWRLTQTQAQRDAHQRFIDRVNASRPQDADGSPPSEAAEARDWSARKRGDLAAARHTKLRPNHPTVVCTEPEETR